MQTIRRCHHPCLHAIHRGADLISVSQDFDFGTASTYYYYPAIDLDSSDSLVTAFTRSSSNEFPSVYVGSRLSSDSTNSLGTPALVKAGLASYLGTRWGDYSGAGVDPSDETAIWIGAEYSNATADPNWGTWIAELRASASAATPTPTRTATPTVTATKTATPTATATVTATRT